MSMELEKGESGITGAYMDLCMGETLTAAQLILMLQQFPPETLIYRHDGEYGPECIDRVWIDPHGYEQKVTVA